MIDVDDIATQQAEVKPLAGLRVFQAAIRSGVLRGQKMSEAPPSVENQIHRVRDFDTNKR